MIAVRLWRQSFSAWEELLRKIVNISVKCSALSPNTVSLAIVVLKSCYTDGKRTAWRKSQPTLCLGYGKSTQIISIMLGAKSWHSVLVKLIGYKENNYSIQIFVHVHATWLFSFLLAVGRLHKGGDTTGPLRSFPVCYCNFCASTLTLFGGLIVSLPYLT